MIVTCGEQVAEGEARASALHREVDRLSVALLKAQEDQSSLKEKTASLRKSLQEVTASNSSAEGRLTALHKTLSEAERVRRALQVSGGGHLGGDGDGGGVDVGGGEDENGGGVAKLQGECDDVSVPPTRNRWTRLGRQPLTAGGWRRPSVSEWRACRAT